MISDIFKILLRFILLILAQVLILNQVTLHGYATPYIYPLFILLFPVATPRWLVLFAGFIIGITMDMFSNTGGIHAFATVFLAFMMPFIQKILTPSDGYEPDDRPTIKDLGFSWFFFYILISVFLHHSVYFLVEVLNFAYPKYLLFKILFSSLVSIAIILLIQFLTYPKKVGKPT